MKTSSRSARFVVGTSTKRRSPGWTTVLPRGGIVSSPRVDHRDQRVARQAQLADGGAGDRVVRRDGEVDEVELAERGRPRAARRGPAGPARAGRARPATHSSVVPCTITDTTTTKKTALKIVFEWVTSEESTNVASTIGTAPRRPAQPRSSRSLFVKLLNAVEAHTAAGRIRSIEHEGQRQSGQRHVRQVVGEDEQAEHDEERDLREEGEALVEGDELPAVARRRAADGEPDQVDREEAAAADHVGGAERERAGGDRGDRGEGADRVGKACEDPRGKRRRARRRRGGRAPICSRSEGRGRRIRTRPDARSTRSGRASARSPVGSLPPDSASSVRASVRRMCVSAASRRRRPRRWTATTAPSRNDSSQVRSNSQYAATPVRSGGDGDPDRAEQGGRHRDLA